MFDVAFFLLTRFCLVLYVHINPNLQRKEFNDNGYRSSND